VRVGEGRGEGGGCEVVGGIKRATVGGDNGRQAKKLDGGWAGREEGKGGCVAFKPMIHPRGRPPLYILLALSQRISPARRDLRCSDLLPLSIELIIILGTRRLGLRSVFYASSAFRALSARHRQRSRSRG
jgi:hypothetical protein